MEKLNALVELAKKADREVTWPLLPFDLAKEGWCVEVVDYIAAMNPHDILAIAENVRALEQRSEAVEAKLVELDKQEPLAWIHEDELPENYPYDAMFPYSKVDIVRLFPVFGPAPAINLTDLVLSEDDIETGLKMHGLKTRVEGHSQLSDGFRAGASWTRDNILRNIKEASLQTVTAAKVDSETGKRYPSDLYLESVVNHTDFAKRVSLEAVIVMARELLSLRNAGKDESK